MERDRACYGDGCPYGFVTVHLLAESFTVVGQPPTSTPTSTRTETRREVRRHLYADGPLGDPYTRRWFLCGDCHARRQGVSQQPGDHLQ